MSYTIEYLDQANGGARRTLPMVFRDKDAALDCACALQGAGFTVSAVEGPMFSMRGAAFKDYYAARRYQRPAPRFADMRARS